METLVLSQSYQPVARVSWQRAVTLLFLGKVEVVEEYEDREIRSVTVAIKIPSIVRFLQSVRRKKKAVKFSRENVYSRDNGQCQYCGNAVTHAEATYDHVVPRRLGGTTNWENIVISCRGCNQKKGGRTPEQAHMMLRSKPVRPKKLADNRWRLTFQWNSTMPPSWRDFLASYSYWNGDLDSD